MENNAEQHPATASPDEAPAARLVMLGDALYTVADFNKRTVIMDHYLQKWIRRTRADSTLPADEEDSSVFCMRLQAGIVDSGHACELVAGFILPQGLTEQEWTIEMAEVTAKKIAALASAEDRETVNTLALELAFFYLKEGVERWHRAQILLAQAERKMSSEPAH